MNTKDSNVTQKESDLDSLFAAARLSQPALCDDNFTKMVINHLPKMASIHQNIKLRKSFSFDLVGALIGLLCAYFFVDQTTVMSSMLALVPESLVISPLYMVAGVSAFMLSSIAAWWAFENVRL